MGYLGSLSQDPLHRIFSKCVFLNLLSPLGLPLPSNALGSSKKLRNFPRGCVEKAKAANIHKHYRKRQEEALLERKLFSGHFVPVSSKLLGVRGDESVPDSTTQLFLKSCYGILATSPSHA